MRYYWRERTREGPESDETSKKQNITAKKPIFFTKRQLHEYRQNPRNALRAADDDDGSESGYDPNADYEADVARLLAKRRMIDDLFNEDLHTWIFNNSQRPAIELDDEIERRRLALTTTCEPSKTRVDF